MDAETIKAIADQIADQTILTSWKTWALQCAIWVVATFGAVWGAAYLAKRGELTAIKFRFDEIKDQLKQNTKAVAEIQTEIAYQDWAAREAKVIKQNKLEELMLCIHEILEWVEKRYQMVFHAQSVELKPCHPERVTMLAELYLPELARIIVEFRYLQTTITVTLTSADANYDSEIMSIESFREKQIQLHQEFSDLFRDLYLKSHEVTVAAAEIMKSTLGVKP